MLKKLCNRKSFPAGVLTILISGQPAHAFDLTNIIQTNLSDIKNPAGDRVKTLRIFDSSLDALSSVVTNGNEKSFSTKLNWFSGMRSTNARTGQIFLNNIEYEIDFTVEDSANSGYIIDIDYALKGVISVERYLDKYVSVNTGLILGRLDDDDGNGLEHHAGFKSGGVGLKIDGTELPTMQQLTVKHNDTFSAPSDTFVGAPASYVGTKNFKVSFSSRPSRVAVHIIENYGRGESILNYGGDNSDPFFTLATNTNGENQSDLGFTAAIKVTSLAPPVGCSTIVENTLDTYPGIAAPGSLRAAIECANSTPGPDFITFDSSTLPVNSIITLAPPTSDPYEQDNYLSISDEVTITGHTSGNPSSIIIEGNNNRIFSSSANLTLENMTLQSGNTSAQPGGAIFIEQTDYYAIPFALNLTLNHTLLTDNHAKSANGGAIYSRNTDVFINNSTLSLNSADGNGSFYGGGGAIHSGYSVNLTNSTVSNNSTTGTANSKGGGIYSFKTVTLDDSTVEGNTTGGSDSSGGGIHTADIVVLKNDSIVSNNKTFGTNSPGGGIFAFDEITLTSSSITENSTNNTNSPGGGIYTKTEFVDISSSTISGNSTSGFESPGGGVHVRGPDDKSIIKQSTISNNTTAFDSSPGGGISSPQGSFDIYNSTFSANATKGASSDGGGIHATSMKLSQSTVSGNHVDNGSSSGGGIHIEGVYDPHDNNGGVFEAPTEIIQSTITENYHISDGTSGISIRALKYDTTIKNSIISDNGVDYSNLYFVNPGGSDPNKIHLSYNLMGNFESDFTGDIGTNIGNIFETAANLLPLSDNGGVTFTHLPKLTSNSIDNGNDIDAPAITDQRGTGFLRKIGSTVDIGSVERYVIPAAVCVPD